MIDDLRVMSRDQLAGEVFCALAGLVVAWLAVWLLSALLVSLRVGA